MKNFLMILAAVFIFAGSASSITIATFYDPAADASTPLFTINGTTKTVTGGWSDAQAGLDLNLVFTSATYNNAFFTLTPLAMTTGSLTYDTTGPGTIKFFENGASADAFAVPLLQIDFDSANIAFGGLSGDSLFSGNGVKFSGSEIGGAILSEEVFAFSFANLKALVGDTGYTATAAFTSSALVIPEPATIAILGIGSMVLALPRRKTA